MGSAVYGLVSPKRREAYGRNSVTEDGQNL